MIFQCTHWLLFFVIFCIAANMFRTVASFRHLMTPKNKQMATSASSIGRVFFSAVAGGEDTIVSRCTQKISSALSPVKITVTSTNDDPNGSHVRHFPNPHLPHDLIKLVRSVIHTRFKSFACHRSLKANQSSNVSAWSTKPFGTS